MRKPIDLTGQRFGRLTIIERLKDPRYAEARWLCQCDCGNQTIVYGGNLRSGNTKSCGCLVREMAGQRFRKHGETHSRLHRIWASMKKRCCNQNGPAYKDYGGRGITVCEEWCNSYEAFRDWALSHGYADDLTIDRIDNDGNYCPDNCRWATPAEQARNTRTTRLIEYDGKTQCLSNWAEQKGIGSKTLLYRISHGWSAERALTTPVRKQKK